MNTWVICFLYACEVLEEKESKIPVDMDGDTFFSDLDCDDSDATIFPGAPEVCNEKDDNCNGLVDDSDPDLDLNTAQVMFLDEDGDEFGSEEQLRCFITEGYSETAGDCDDQTSSIHPDMVEVCNGIDDNCDGLTDVDAIDRFTWFLDLDEDGFGDRNHSQQDCEQPPGYVSSDSDCDDSNAQVNVDAQEICNDIDDDCDVHIDDDDDNVDWSTGVWFYLDADGDGFGTEEYRLQRCRLPAGYSEWDTDCNDADGSINPASIEVCDGIDNDCDSLTIEDGIASFSIGTASEKENIDSQFLSIHSLLQEHHFYFCTGDYTLSLSSEADLTIEGIGEVSLFPLDDFVLEQRNGSLSMLNVDVYGRLLFDNAQVSIEQGEIASIDAGSYSALEAEDSALLLQDILIYGNDSAMAGGGVYLQNSTLELNESDIFENQALNAGGIYANESSISMIDSRVFDNTAEIGGGLLLQDSTASCVGDTFDSFGVHQNSGAGIYMDSSSSFTALNCDFETQGIHNEPYDIVLDERHYFAQEDGSFSCSQGLCGSSIAYTISGLLVDDYSNNDAFRGNVYDVSGYPTLDSFDMALDFSSCDVDFYVYLRPTPQDPWTLLWTESDSFIGGTGWVSSSLIGIPLEDGEQILLGVGWVCDSAPDYYSYAPSGSDYGIGFWSGYRAFDASYQGSVGFYPTNIGSSSYLYQQRLYVTEL